MLGLSRGISSYKETFELTSSDARKDHASSLFDCTAEYQIESQGNVRKSSGIKRIERKQKSIEGEMAATKHSMMYGIIETTLGVCNKQKFCVYLQLFYCPYLFLFIVFQGWWQYNTWNNGYDCCDPFQNQCWNHILWQPLHLKKRCNHASCRSLAAKERQSARDHQSGGRFLMRGKTSWV